MAVADNDIQYLTHLTIHHETFNFRCYYPQWLQQLTCVHQCENTRAFSSKFLSYDVGQKGQTFYSVYIQCINGTTLAIFYYIRPITPLSLFSFLLRSDSGA